MDLDLIALDTIHEQLSLLRAEANEDTDLLDLTSEGNFANKPASAFQLKTATPRQGHGGNSAEISFTGGAAADKTFTYKLYGWRKGNGPARLPPPALEHSALKPLLLTPRAVRQQTSSGPTH